MPSYWRNAPSDFSNPIGKKKDILHECIVYSGKCESVNVAGYKEKFDRAKKEYSRVAYKSTWFDDKRGRNAEIYWL